MALSGITTVPDLKRVTGLSWEKLALLTRHSSCNLKRKRNDKHGKTHRLIDGEMYTTDKCRHLEMRQEILSELARSNHPLMAVNGMGKGEQSTIPKVKHSSGMTWHQLSATTGYSRCMLIRYCSDWDGKNHRVIDGVIYTKTRGQSVSNRKSRTIDLTKRIINIMAASGMMEDEIAARLSMKDEEVEQAINDAFVESSRAEGADILVFEYKNTSRFRPAKVKKRKKKQSNVEDCALSNDD